MSQRLCQNLGAAIWVSAQYLSTANSPVNRGISSNGASVPFSWIIDQALPSVRLVMSNFTVLQWLKKCPHVSQILKDSIIARHILNIIPNAWWLT